MAKKFRAKCARKHSTNAFYFSRDCDHKQREEINVTQHRNKHRSRGFLDQWLSKKRAPGPSDVVVRTKFGLFCTRRFRLRSTMTERKNRVLQVPLVVPYKALEKFPKALYGTTGGTCSAQLFRPVMLDSVL